MRKSNSEFKAAFVSEAGAGLANNDYFAYVELDDYACYVLASGITDFDSSEAAKMAVEHLLLSFEEHPGMARGMLVQHMKETNDRLLAANSRERLKASVLMVVTDYERLRYVAAGNVRLRMYRQGRLFQESSDMSLAKDLIDRGESDTPLDRHEERNNLYAYLGKPDFFHPYVSEKFKLKDADIVAFYTGGFWSHVDAQEIDEIFHGASNEPKESLDALEELLLSRQPKDLRSYTFAAVFVNKSYRDPERERKRLMYIRIAIIVLIILIIGGLIAWYLNHRHARRVESLRASIGETVEYMQAENFVRAQETCKTAMEKAKDLRKGEEEARMRRYLVLIDAILAGDGHYKDKDYASAFDVYMGGLELSKDADLMGMDYLQRKIDQTEEALYVGDFIAMGDKAMEAGDLNLAESLYYKARDKASVVHDSEGREAAMAALNRLYDERAKQQAEGEKKLKESSQAAVADAMKKGDELMAKGDVEGAEKAYLEARSIANASGDASSRGDAMGALDKVREAKAAKAVEAQRQADDQSHRYAMATDAASKGDAAFANADYVSAMVYYQSAMEKFTALGELDTAASMQLKFGLAEQKSKEGLARQESAASMEQQARAAYAGKDYAKAKQLAAQAKQLYTALGDGAKVKELDLLLQQIDMDLVIEENMQ